MEIDYEHYRRDRFEMALGTDNTYCHVDLSVGFKVVGDSLPVKILPKGAKSTAGARVTSSFTFFFHGAIMEESDPSVIR